MAQKKWNFSFVYAENGNCTTVASTRPPDVSIWTRLPGSVTAMRTYPKAISFPSVGAKAVLVTQPISLSPLKTGAF